MSLLNELENKHLANKISIKGDAYVENIKRLIFK